jgi:hypothetical protein
MEQLRKGYNVNYTVNVEITGNIIPINIKLNYGRCTRMFGHPTLQSIWQNIDLIKSAITCCKEITAMPNK